MNIRVFVRTLFFVVLIASVGFVIYANVFVSGGSAEAGRNPEKAAVGTMETGNTVAVPETQSGGESAGAGKTSPDQIVAENGTKTTASQGSNSSRSYVKEATVIRISALGDVALGQDSRFQNGDSFNYVFQKQKGNYGYFFSNVVGILSKDDLTIANLETTLSTETKTAEKYDYGNNYWFNGNPAYANILKAGSVEIANLANNHTYDYGQKGYDATRKALKDAGVESFGYSDVLVREVKGIRVGMIGFNQLGNVEQGLDMNVFQKDVTDGIRKLRGECDLLIANFHWGKEYQFQYNDLQKKLAYLAIDSGADLVIGNHPHVLQPIAKYKGKYIAYSLGNFCFGGTKKPRDYDTAIYQQSFAFDSNKVLQPVAAPTIVPCSASSLKGLNNYRPAVASGTQAASVLKKLGLSGVQAAGTASAGTANTTGAAMKKTMVELNSSLKDIGINLRYASTNNIVGKKVYESNTAFLRKGTADKLNKANQILLKQGYRIMVWDAYRALKYQQFLYDNAPVKAVFMNPQKGFSNHTRGAAVDCTLVDGDGNEVDMPSDFDDGSSLAYRTYAKCTEKQKENALILENAMKSCGFIPLKNEWWHFDDSDYKNYEPLPVYPEK